MFNTSYNNKRLGLLLLILGVSSCLLSAPALAKEKNKKHGRSHYSHFGYGYHNYFNSHSRFNRRFGNHYGYGSFQGSFNNSFSRFDSEFINHAGYRSIAKPYDKFKLNKKRYYHKDGSFFRRRSGVYYPVYAPVGALVAKLPPNSVKLSHQNSNYHYANNALYQLDAQSNQYNVVTFPENLVLPGNTEQSAFSTILFSYPKKGQSDEQMEQDRSECKQWALKQNNTDSEELEDASFELQGNYLRALSACLEGRHYNVK